MSEPRAICDADVIRRRERHPSRIDAVGDALFRRLLAGEGRPVMRGANGIDRAAARP